MKVVTLLFLSAVLAQAADVTLSQQGNEVVLANGLVTVTINRQSGDVIQAEYQETPVFSEPAYLDWHTGRQHRIRDGEFSIAADPKQNRGEMAEVVITRKWTGGEGAFDVALHHVLRRGDSGYYSYAVFRHPGHYPDTGFGQSRLVSRVRDEVFDFINIDDQRRRPMPPADTAAEVLGPKETSRFTQGRFEGFITDKYHFSADVGGHFVHGWSGTESRLGCWIIKGSNEDHNGGPTKQRNTAHFPRVLLYILTCGHYGAAPVTITAGQDWTHVYGPWMTYFNSGGDTDALWIDANKKAAAEQAAWPFAWVSDPAYASARERGTVSGQLRLSDPQNPHVNAGGAWVGLAAPSPDWQQQSGNSQFWTRAAADGTFRIANVRPGSYTLHAFAEGAMDEFRQDDIEVPSGEKVDLGALPWTAKHYGRQVWQIGTLDRTASEFRHGDDFRQWGLWKKYPADFPNDVHFVVGQSRERTDWNYSQVTVEEDGKFVGTTWRISFELKEPPPPGTAVLRFAFAGAQNAALKVAVNGETAGDSGRIGTDNAMARAGIHGQYSQWDLKFDAALLVPGENTITLEQRAGGSPWKNVMYDSLRLEVPE